jgi:hypothetical protein
MLNSPKVQNRQQMGRLSECGHCVFVSSVFSPASASSSPRTVVRNRGSIGSATELELLEATETGLELRDEANELGSEGRQARDLCSLLGAF